MSGDKPQTAVVCAGEVDSDDEEPPTPRVLDPHAGPQSSADRNVFFLKQTSDEASAADFFSRSDSYCDGPTPTTEGYKALEEAEAASQKKEEVTSEQKTSSSSSDQNKKISEQDVTSSRSMTESSDIEVIMENSSSSIEVLDSESPVPYKSIIDKMQQGFMKENVLSNGTVKHSGNTFDEISNCQSVAQSTTVAKHDIKHAKIMGSQSPLSTSTADSGVGTGSDIASSFQPVTSGISNGVPDRPQDLSLPKPLKVDDPKSRLKHKQSESDIEVFEDDFTYSFRDTDKLLEVVTSTPLQEQGEISTEGDLMAFVAEDLQEKIRLSSPVSRTDSYVTSRYGSRTPSSRSMSSLNSYSSSSASGWSGVSTSGGMSRSPSVLTQSPEDMPPVDPRAVFDLDFHARKVAESVEVMMKNLQSNLHKMSGFTHQSLLAYKEGVDNTCDSVDATIKSMYALMAKCEELSKSMQPVYELGEQIKEIKRLLELFESQLVKED